MTRSLHPRSGAILPLRLVSVLAAMLILLALAATSAWGGAPTDTLRDVFNAANKLLAAAFTGSEPADAADPLFGIRVLLDKLFEFRDVAELTLGSEWQARTASEQDEFTHLFSDLLQLSYVQMVAAVAYANSGVDVRYLGEAVDRDSATVRTALVSSKKGNVLLDYEMARRDDRWLIRDVLVEGISVTANYRAQFQRIIRESSYAELIARIKTKTADWTRLSALAAETHGASRPAGHRDLSDAVWSAWLQRVNFQAP